MNDLWDNVEVISTYSREQAIEDGILVDCTEWASANKGILGGILGNGHDVPTVMTRALFDEITPGKRSSGDLRGRAHDVLWMSGLALRPQARMIFAGEQVDVMVQVIVGNKTLRLRASAVPGEGITIGFPEDF